MNFKIFNFHCAKFILDCASNSRLWRCLFNSKRSKLDESHCKTRMALGNTSVTLNHIHLTSKLTFCSRVNWISTLPSYLSRFFFFFLPHLFSPGLWSFCLLRPEEVCWYVRLCNLSGRKRREVVGCLGFLLGAKFQPEFAYSLLSVVVVVVVSFGAAGGWQVLQSPWSASADLHLYMRANVIVQKRWNSL